MLFQGRSSDDSLMRRHPRQSCGLPAKPSLTYGMLPNRRAAPEDGSLKCEQDYFFSFAPLGEGLFIMFLGEGP